MQKNQKTYSVAEAARAKGRTVTAIYQALRAGRIPGAKKMYDRWFIPASYVESRAKRHLQPHKNEYHGAKIAGTISATA